MSRLRNPFLCLLVFFAASSLSLAQRQEPTPRDLEEVGITERLEEQIPLDLTFRDEQGRQVILGDYFSDRPVILSLTYSNCPMLCYLQLDGLVRALQDLDFSPGKEFEIVNVSVDPNESSQRALVTKRKHVEMYGRQETAGGWHFLTGSEASIKRLAATVGFRYKFVPERNEYAHAAAIMIATPEGRLSRYLYGVVYSPPTLRLALVEAGQGKIGTTLDQVLLFCFHYDATSGSYAPAAMRIMQIGGCLTLTALLLGVVPFWLRRTNGTSNVGNQDLGTSAVAPKVPLNAESQEPLVAK